MEDFLERFAEFFLRYYRNPEASFYLSRNREFVLKYAAVTYHLGDRIMLGCFPSDLRDRLEVNLPQWTTHPFRETPVLDRLDEKQTVSSISAKCLARLAYRRTKPCHRVREYSRGLETSFERS